jgi:putative DNA primase/helicase
MSDVPPVINPFEDDDLTEEPFGSPQEANDTLVGETAMAGANLRTTTGRLANRPDTYTEIALWQGKIAVAAKNGTGLDVLKQALNWAKQEVPQDNGLREKAKQEIRETAERHLTEVQGARVLDAIYFCVFPEDATNNDQMDADVLSGDEDAEIRRLAKLPAIQYDRQRKAIAANLGITVKALDADVKAARAEDTTTKGQGRPLEFPVIEPWPDPVNGAELLNEIRDALKRYLVLPEGSAEILTLWVVHTDAYKCFGHSPRLAITSPEKGCGKTTTLDIVGELVARPLPTSNATTAAIFRIVEKASPTLLIDEADTFLKDNEELRGILNSGHKKGGQCVRTVGEDHDPRLFSTWAPAAIAMIGRLPDTLEDRSVSISLRRKKPTERVQQFRSDKCPELKMIARKIARWVEDNREVLAAADPDTGTLFNRVADNWRPLLAIADLAGDDWPRIARNVAETAETAKDDQSSRSMVLSDIRDIFAARPGVDRLPSAAVVDALGAMENRPWSEWRAGKPITPAALAKLLRPFRIAPATRRGGSSTFKGYLLADFAEAFESYLPSETVTPSQSNNDGLYDGSESVTLAPDVTVPNASQPNNDRLCDGVTVANPWEEEL